ncbi:MAG: lytic transglycosylase domain-containing protein [Candidatus Cloacimonadales bacterium]|jgi:soluble lytic murein transglycosylase|nr:lytic transglycosylase domain-containing protein [Candidatus Cloacimonadota bacterium]MDY0381175.1 lytic transglycosylase domain-containing protein [Candidatus Cloacimonadaceae bacterium]MCB5256277.1 lytic transglycosylase domain-containing protein [Candidatus Cloacimonadota bacterium]MCB5263902.1 lytic transglycosylase domain-containing protein [Candidatus Cloacimonadota bacterium]MCB5276897.1 lytic transglycosylase domain-containing protein [Candidatus Cloacimonadota bacterium]
MAKRRKRKLIGMLLAILALSIILTYNPVSVRVMTVAVAVWHKIDPAIFYRLIRTESSFRSFAISPKSAIGLGQMRERTAEYINSEHKRGMLFVPVYNLNLSARYLSYLYQKFNGNWSLVLAAYNWGESNVLRRMKGIQIDPDEDYRDKFRDIPETWNYIAKILPPRKKA